MLSEGMEVEHWLKVVYGYHFILSAKVFHFRKADGIDFKRKKNWTRLTINLVLLLSTELDQLEKHIKHKDMTNVFRVSHI